MYCLAERKDVIARIIPEVRSNNLAATHDFYTNVLGLVIDREENDFLMVSSSINPSVQLIVNDNGYTGLPPGFAIDVGDIGQLELIHATVTQRGLPIVEPCTSGTSFWWSVL